jgi:hypothetical protein
MRTFHLDRTEDVSGISGIGIVAEGCQFSNGKVALCWKSGVSSVAVYDSLRDLQAIHGHGTKTELVMGPPQVITTDKEGLRAAYNAGVRDQMIASEPDAGDRSPSFDGWYAAYVERGQ